MAPRIPTPYAPIAGDDCRLDRNFYIPDVNPAAFGDGMLQNNGVMFNLSEQFFGSLELNYDISNALTLTSVTSYYDVNQNSLGNITVSSHVAPVFLLDGSWDKKDFTQELRLTSALDGPFNYMFGGFYQKADLTYAFDIPVNRNIIALGIPLPTSLGQFSSAIDIETFSLFGQALFKITPELELGAGARWTSEDRKIVPTLVTGPSYSPGGIVLPIVKNALSAKNWSPELTLTYTPNPDLTVFASLKQAYKSGSFDVGGSIAPGSNIAFGDERVQSAELGLKSRMLDGALRFNLAGYYQKFKDLQVKAGSIVTAGSIAVRTRECGFRRDLWHRHGFRLVAAIGPRLVALWRGQLEPGQVQGFPGRAVLDGTAGLGRLQSASRSGDGPLRCAKPQRPPPATRAGMDRECRLRLRYADFEQPEAPLWRQPGLLLFLLDGYRGFLLPARPCEAGSYAGSGQAGQPVDVRADR